ncbi:glycoside hydrolase 15 protein [Blyttiomyces sp. JEL0837]|nr:glycoside hydrolase 15 protein [Blyttiomyces sp. JEL0837]
MFKAPTQDSVWTLDLAVPLGYYEYKVALDGSWNVNYGDNGVSYGPNVPLYVPADSNITFFWDQNSHIIYNSATAPFYYVVGDFQAAVGCTSNDSPNCYQAILTPNADKSQESYTTTALKAGTYKASLYISSEVPALGKLSQSPISFTVNNDFDSVTFAIAGTGFDVSVAGTVETQVPVPTPTTTVGVPPPPTDTGVTPTGTASCIPSPFDHVITVPVKVHRFAYIGNTINGEIRVQNKGFQKTVTVNWADNSTTPQWGYSCNAYFANGPYQSNFEVWKFTCVVPPTGISQFYVHYIASGSDFYDSNGGSNYQVTKVPNQKFTKGLQRDIYHYFERAVPRAKKYMLDNISPANTSVGVVVAAPQKQMFKQNYFYHWIRDASLTMDVVNSLYEQGDSSLAQKLWDYATFTHKIQNIDAQTGLGEPKFEVNGTDYLGGWCRPQNDGPAFRSSALIRFSKAYLKNGGDLSRVISIYNSQSAGVIKPDLDYVVANWQDFKTCDLWEEQSGEHFFTMMAIRRSLHDGAEFATFLNDTESATVYQQTAVALDQAISSTFWSTQFNTLITTNNGRQLDSAIPLGVIHGGKHPDNVDDLFPSESEQVLATLYTFANGMLSEYGVNDLTNPKVPQYDEHDLPLGVSIGRYYGDHYDGVRTNFPGNPWYLTTAAFAEVYYRAATAFVKNGAVNVTDLTLPFIVGPRPAGLEILSHPSVIKAKITTINTAVYAKGSPVYDAIIDSLSAVADSYMRRVRFHQSPDGRYNEEFNRDCGDVAGVNDLTWSYASVISAWFARNDLIKVTGWYTSP